VYLNRGALNQKQQVRTCSAYRLSLNSTLQIAPVKPMEAESLEELRVLQKPA